MKQTVQEKRDWHDMKTGNLSLDKMIMSYFVENVLCVQHLTKVSFYNCNEVQ